jgi:hypothetical protein
MAKDAPKKTLLFSANVTDIIEAVVSTQAGYDWRMEDGVVHVFQRDLAADSRNPLNVTIKSFEQHAETIGRANNTLGQMVAHIVRHPGPEKIDRLQRVCRLDPLHSHGRPESAVGIRHRRWLC